MAEFVIDADRAGSFSESVGHNGTNDTVIVNIGPGFSGVILVNSEPNDGEIETSRVNLPPGWRLELQGNNPMDSEDPAFNQWAYFVQNEAGQVVGLLYIRSNNDPLVPCFLRGTMIETPQGPVAIEDLRVGAEVLTRDHGPQVLRWIGSVRLHPGLLAAVPQLRPIRIAAGALGKGVPSADLTVSPQHRVLVRSAIAQRMFGAPEVLVAAKQLVLLPGIDIAPDAGEVEYFHMLFDRHEIVISNGAETESLHTGPEALKSVGAAAAAEIFALFPELREDGARVPARVLTSGRRGRKLAMRHLQHGRPLLT